MAQIPDNSTAYVTYREFQLLRRYLYPSLDEPRRGTDDVEVMFLMKRLYDDFNRSPVLVPFSGDRDGTVGSSASVPSLELIMRRPKVVLRHTTDPALRLAIKSYIINRRTQAAEKAFEYVKQLLGRGLAMDTRFPVDQLEKDEGGVRNLCAILDDQPYQNSTFTVAEIRMILDSYGLEPDEAVIWFRARRR